MTTDLAARPYDTLMADAERMLNAGDFPGAAYMYDEALSATEDPRKMAETLHMQGIALSRAGELKGAETVFEFALVFADALDDEVFMYRLMRDIGMAYLDAYMRNPVKGLFFLRQAERLLYRSESGLRHLDELVESHVSLGFIGRYELIMGSPVMARTMFATAHEFLSTMPNPNLDYILNNLMWYLRVMTRSERRQCEDFVLELIVDTGQTRRYAELRVIMIGGDFLYRATRLVPTSLIKRVQSFMR